MTPIRLVPLCLLAAVFLFVGAPLPPPAGAASVTDHLQCYQMKDGLNLAGVVDLDAPDLGLAAGCKISKAKLYCTPTSAVVVSADDKGTKSPISPLPFVGAPRPGDQICYKVKCPNPVPPIADQTATDRFGSRTLTKLKSSLMCTPAVRGTSYCGNGALDAGEECDGASLGGATCSDRGYQSGTLACSPWCTFDTAACSSSCGGTGCTGGTVACGGACTNLTFDPSNCGACGAACPGATNASPACGGGRCGLVCNALYEDCNDSWADGCETSTGSDPNNCGGCGTTCASVPHASATVCNAGSCEAGSCDAGYLDCDGVGANGCEAKPQWDDENCGACGVTCAASQWCKQGACTAIPANPTNFNLLAVKYANLNVPEQTTGNSFQMDFDDYLVLKVSLKSTTSAATTWCQDYANLCAIFGTTLAPGFDQPYQGIGCRDVLGYGQCPTDAEYLSQSGTCNPVAPVMTAAAAAGFDQYVFNSFAFGDCRACTNTMPVNGNQSLSLPLFSTLYPVGYTLCKR